MVPTVLGNDGVRFGVASCVVRRGSLPELCDGEDSAAWCVFWSAMRVTEKMGRAVRGRDFWIKCFGRENRTWEVVGDVGSRRHVTYYGNNGFFNEVTESISVYQDLTCA